MKLSKASHPQIQQHSPALPVRVRATLFAGSILAGLVVATQVFAWRVHFSPALGSNWQHVYPPWRIIVWQWQWGAAIQKEIMPGWGAGVLTVGIGLLLISLLQTAARHSGQAMANLHGSARWAKRRDIEEAGLLAEDGVYVGSWIDDRGRQVYLRHNGQEHVLAFAPTRSGKGVGLVIPTLLAWRHSAVVTDLKGELWALTAGWRKQHAGQKVLRFEPASLSGGVAWNPMDEIRLGTEHEVGDVQNLATLIVDPHGKGMEDHWSKTAQALLVGVILHVLWRTRNGDARRSHAARSGPDSRGPHAAHHGTLE